MYKYKEIYKLDFTNIKCYSEIHKIIASAFDFPEYYGENFDAMWDCLTDIAGRKNIVEIYGLDIIREKFDGTAEILTQIFSEWKHWLNDKYCDITHIYVIDGKTEYEIR